MTQHTRPRGAGSRAPRVTRATRQVASGLVVVAALVAVAAALRPLPAAATQYPPLSELVLQSTVPGFAATAPGPMNGPLDVSTFASTSSDPQTARTTFEHLTTIRGFAAFIRLWNDPSGPAAGSNDVVELLFRIPDRPRAAAFTGELRRSLAGADHTTTFPVPAVPDAAGYTATVTDPVKAVEHAVVMRAGIYVTLVELASATAPTNTTTLTPDQAASIARAQYQRLASAPGASPRPSTPRTAAPAPSAHGSDVAWILAAVLSVLVLAAAVAGLALRRRWSAPGAAGVTEALERLGAVPGAPPVDPERARPVPTMVASGQSATPVGPAATETAGSPNGAQTGVRNGPRVDGIPTDRSPVDGIPTDSPHVGDGPTDSAPGPVREESSGAVEGLRPLPEQHPAIVGHTASSPGETPIGQPAAAAPAWLDEPAPGTPKGWFPDPSGEPGTIRYWDGLAWTSFVAVRRQVD